MRVAIVARRTPTPEPQHDRYRRELLRRGHAVVDVDVAAFVSGPVEIDVTGACFVGGVRLLGGDADVDAVLVGALPGPAARTRPDGVVLDAAAHARLTRTQVERHLVARALVVELEARGVPVISKTASFACDNKLTQLFALARAGLPLPKTRVTDRDAGADDVVKGVSGGPARTGVALTPGAPQIVQERIRGVDLRAVVVGGVCIGVGRFALSDDDDDSVVDVRERPGFRDGTQPWLYDDDEAARALAERAAAVCGVDVCAVDLKRSAQGLFVLEVNRTPVVGDLDDDLGLGVDGAVVDLVEARVRDRR